MLRPVLPLTSVGAVAALVMASACSRTNDTPIYAGSNLTVDDLPVKVTAPVEGMFDQPIDHPTRAPADGAPAPTFKQRYWYTTEFADGPDSPVLFNFCGEAPCSKYELTYMSDVAKVLHASIVALEHRYYGKSTPFEDLSLEHMKYLSVHNALEDVITFEAYAKTSLPLSGKWVAVGGSYSGMLAAFLR